MWNACDGIDCSNCLNPERIAWDVRRPRWILGYSMAVDGLNLRVLERQRL